MKPAGEEVAEVATISAPTKLQVEGHQASAGEVNGFISPTEETPSPPQSVVQDGPAVPPNAPRAEPASAAQAPQERPVTLQEGRTSMKPAVKQINSPEVEGEDQPSLPTNGFSGDSTDTSVLSPSSLSDSDLIEAVVNETSSLVPEKLMPEELAGVNDQLKENPTPDKDNVTDGKDETSDKISHLKETLREERGLDVPDCIIVRTSCQDEVVSRKHSDAKNKEKALSESIQGYDVPDGLESDDLPSVSEAEPPSLKPEPKKQQSLFKRNKKKNNQGKPPINLNKDRDWNTSLCTCLKGRSIVVLFLLHFAFYILCTGYFNI